MCLGTGTPPKATNEQKFVTRPARTAVVQSPLVRLRARGSPLRCSCWHVHTALPRRDSWSTARLRVSPATGPLPSIAARERQLLRREENRKETSVTRHRSAKCATAHFADHTILMGQLLVSTLGKTRASWIRSDRYHICRGLSRVAGNVAPAFMACVRGS